MELMVYAYDIHGVEFDDDQYRLMDFNIEIEISVQREKGLITTRNPENNRKFTAYGHESGNY